MGRSILHLIDSLDPRAGGPVEFVKAVSREHAATGHKSSAALLTWPDGPAPGGLEILWAGKKQAFGGYGFHTGFVAWLRQEARRHDAIFVHGLWQYHGPAVWLALSSLDTPYFVFPHGMLDPWFAGDRARHRKKQFYWHAIEKRVLRKARAVLFTSQPEMARAPQSFGKSWPREELVELGIAEPPADAEAQQEAFFRRFPALKGRRILLFLGRVDRKKGCELLGQAFAGINAKEDWDLVLAGPCPDASYRGEIERIGARIHFTGMLDGPEKWGALRSAEVFALPSHQENFGIAVAEALACATPVLISTAIDIHPTVTQARAGFADTDDLAGTQRLLNRWLTLPKPEQHQMRAAASDCFHTHFHIRRTASRMLALVEG